jgi:hypothetical protein
MSKFSFSCQALVGSNKAGKLKQDERGYYEVVLGALEFGNSVNAIYTENSAQQLFRESSSFMRKISRGYMRGEYGHPKMERGMTHRDWLTRILTVDEGNISHHIREVSIDKARVSDRGVPVIAIMGWVAPSGIHGAVLQRSLDNPDENVAFSIRSLTEDRIQGGRINKDLREIVTWDFVNEPGLSVANKYQSPSLEGLQQDLTLDLDTLRDMVEHPDASNVSLEARQQMADILHRLERSVSSPKIYVPASSSW